jgi:hypothetical protein
VILASDPQHQVRVLLEINNPDGDRSLSEAMVAQIQGNRY